VFIVVALRRQINLGVAMFVAAVGLGLMFGMKPAALAQGIVASVFALDSLRLVLALLLVMVLENVMRQAGFLGGMTSALGRLVRDRRVVAASLPLLVGFLPSAGGALFSAPMVGEATRGMPVSPERRSFINFWFRHPMEFVMPLYPGVMISSKLLGLGISAYVALTAPFFVIAIISGALVGFHGLPRSVWADRDAGRATRADWVALANGLVPIMAVVIGAVLLKLDIALVLGAVALLTAAYARISARMVIEFAREAVASNVIFLVAGVMGFKGVLESSGALNELPAFFEAAGVPMVLVAFLMPFLVGFLTGYAPAYAGLALPVVAGLGASAAGVGAMVGAAGIEPSIGYALLGVVSGQAGVMLSPAHLCLTLTVAHFKADFGRVCKLIAVPEAVLVGAAVVRAIVR
jgi:integral membrane protein (TIGR00529 family)